MTYSRSIKNLRINNDSCNEDEDIAAHVHDIEEFHQIVQSNASKITQCNNDSSRVSSEITCQTTDSREINKKRESQMAFDKQNKLQLSQKNRLDNIELEQRRQAISPGPPNNNVLAISGSIENLLSSAGIEMITTIENKETDTSPCIIQSPYACVQSKIIAFPQVLHEILETAKENGYDKVISWQHHGRSFRVEDKITFVATIIPQYFNQTRYTSFQRQLALYGFVRLTKKDSEDFGSYYHKQFLRGNSELACMIQRTGVNGSGQIKLFSTETEPDFQAMESVGIDGGVNVDNIPNITTRTPLDSQTEEELFCNIPKKIQWNAPSKGLLVVASSEIVCLTTADREINTNRESHMSLHYQTKFQLPNQNSLDNDDRKKRGQTKRSLSLTNSSNLAIASSIENQRNFTTIENMTPINTTACIIQNSLASVQSKNIAFPQVLHSMLQLAKENGYDNIISWQHNGRSFRVEDKKAFVMTIIPRYFNQTRYSSFRRQLLLYGFVRSAKKTSKDYGSYHHESFLRGHPNLACMIQRTGVTGPRRLLSPETEPNSQAMEGGEAYSMMIVDNSSKQTSAPKPITSYSCSHHPSHQEAVGDQSTKDNCFAIDSVNESQIKVEEMKSAVKQPDHHEVHLPEQMKVSSEKDDQNIVDNSECISTTIDDDEAVSMAEFLTDMNF